MVLTGLWEVLEALLIAVWAPTPGHPGPAACARAGDLLCVVAAALVWILAPVSETEVDCSAWAVL